MSKSSCCQLNLEPILTDIAPPSIIKTAILPGQQAETLFLATADGEISTVEADSADWYQKRFLEIQDLVTEGGFHGLEFHPDFAENGRFFLHYSVRDSEGTPPYALLPDPDYPESLDQEWNDAESYHHYDTVEEWLLPETGIPICVRILLNIKWPFSNHTGMNTLTWTDGRLILSTGDGGSNYDPFNQAQKNTSLLGKIIAMNVDHRPWKFTKNPAPVSETNELDPIRREAIKIVAKGLQNPSGLEVDGPVKYLADMGQDEMEKIMTFTDWKKNFGWRAWDGIAPTRGHRGDVLYHGESLDLFDCDRPSAFYSHREVRPELPIAPPQGIIGGCIYHGEKIPGLKGHYVFADAGGDLFSIQGCDQDSIDRPQVPCLLRPGKEDLILTGVGANRRRTRLFVGGYDEGIGGLYELVG